MCVGAFKFIHVGLCCAHQMTDLNKQVHKIQMNSANIVRVLTDSLHPSTTHAAYQQLSQMRSLTGFAVQLLLISDDCNLDIAIRQSALIYLKNVVQDHCQSNAPISEQDLEALRCSLLQALIRNVTNTKLTPTFREIIYQLTEKYYPKQWTSIVDQSIAKIEQSSEMTDLLGAVEALKAVFSVFGGSVVREIELSNLCNTTVIPMLGLASKLFQNFNPDTATILVSIFKLLSTAIHLHLPTIIELNIHSVMIFIKKLLDIKAQLGDPSNTNLYILKRISLRILFRIYQRHANLKFTSNKQFALQFQGKYTKAFVETLVLQVLGDQASHDSLANHRNMELIKLSLSCLAYINRQNSEAAALLNQHRDAMVRLCLQKFRVSSTRSYQNFTDFKLYVQENRVHLKQFLFSLLRNDCFPEEQEQAVTSLLGLLLECLEKGDDELKELSLYIFSEMSAQVQYLKNSLDEKMEALIIQYVKPLIKQTNNVSIRARACQLISSYNYLDLPEAHLIEIAQDVYTCLLVGNSEKETYLKIYACNAFNSLMKYAPIVEFVKPHLQDILKIYTSLLEVDVSIIKNFQDLLNLLEEDIAPFANDLVGLLIGLFENYSRQDKNQQQQGYSTLGKEEGDGEEEDDTYEEEEDNNNQNIAKACISSIRQVLQAESTQLDFSIREKLFDIVVQVFADPLQLYIQEGYNILNLILYKLQQPVQDKYYIFFRVIAYAILGLPPHYIDNLRKKGDNFSFKYADILQNICVDPDSDLIENSIGCLRNFIAKSQSGTLRSSKDDFNFSHIDYLFKIVKFVHENQSQKWSQTDRLIILTIYITLIEYQTVNEQQLGEIISNVVEWMRMEQQVVAQNDNNHFSTFGKAVTAKYTYSSIYLQIILLAIHFYGKAASQLVNVDLVVTRAVALLDSFKCDYELERVIVGLADILANQQLRDNGIIASLMNSIPEMVRRLCKLRQDGDHLQNDVEMDDEAQEQKFFGDDENSHMNAWKQSKGATANDLLLKGEEEEEDDDDWEQEFNKFYLSPLDKLDEIKYMGDVLARTGSLYGGFMEVGKQEELSLYLLNAPAKTNCN